MRKGRRQNAVCPFLKGTRYWISTGFSVLEIQKDSRKKHQPSKKGLVLEIPQCSVSSSMLRSSATRGDTVLTAASLEISILSTFLLCGRQMRFLGERLEYFFVILTWKDDMNMTESTVCALISSVHKKKARCRVKNGGTDRGGRQLEV